MIIKIPTIQIEKFWEVIKFASIKADGIKEENISSYSINLLYDLLNEKSLCLISFNKEMAVQRILIVSFVFSKETNAKGMFFNILYGFETGTAEEWAEESQQIYNFAKKENCSFISMTTNNPQVKILAERYGFGIVSENYQINF